MYTSRKRPSWWKTLQTITDPFLCFWLLDVCTGDTFWYLSDDKYNVGNQFQTNWICIHSFKDFLPMFGWLRSVLLSEFLTDFHILCLNVSFFPLTRKHNPMAPRWRIMVSLFTVNPCSFTNPFFFKLYENLFEKCIANRLKSVSQFTHCFNFWKNFQPSIYFL